MKAKLAFISAHGSTYSIRRLCSVLGVARSWFHDWQTGAPARSAESHVEAELVDQIRGIFQDSGERYGAPRVHAELRAQGLRIARKREQRIRWRTLGSDDHPGQHDRLSGFGSVGQVVRTDPGVRD
jgi:putative transposase